MNRSGSKTTGFVPLCGELSALQTERGKPLARGGQAEIINLITINVNHTQSRDNEFPKFKKILLLTRMSASSMRV